MPGPTVGAPQFEQGPSREPVRQHRRRPPCEDGQRADSYADPGDPEQPLDAAKILGPVELKMCEVLFGLNRGGLDQAAARPEQVRRHSGGGHRDDERKRQPRTPHLPTL